MICTVREFDEVADDLEFTEAHKKFTNFRKCLRDVARDDWDTAKVGQAITIAGFKATMYARKLRILPKGIYEAQKNYIETVKKLYTMTTLEDTRVRKAVVLVAEIVIMDAVTIQVEDVDIKDVLIKEEDVVRLTNVQVHGRCPIPVSMKQSTIRVVITVMFTLGSSAMVSLMDRIIGQGSLLDLMEQPQAVVAVDSVAVVEMEVIGMTPTTKMMQLLMLALIIMRRVQHQERLQTIPMLLDGALVISLLKMQLSTIIGLTPPVCLNDARATHSSLSRQTEDLILPLWRTVI
eukprot:scaffold32449_cov55-Attheya_sp.AAC.5